MGAAHGVYRYWRDAALTDIREPWRLESTGQGWRLHGQRLDADRVLLQIEARGHGAACSELTVRWRPQDDASRQTVHYRLDDGILLWRTLDSDQVHREPLPDGCRLFPLLRVATGALLPDLAVAPGWLVLPSLRDPQDRIGFLRPLLSRRSAEHCGVDDQGIRHFRYYGGEYGDTGCDCWVDAHGLLRRYCWDSPQGTWTVALDDTDATGFSGWR
jgi:hypothetical protein